MGIVPNTNPSVVRYLDLYKSLGRSALHSLFPDDFEAYFIALELVNSNNETVEFFVFPVMVEQINEIEVTNINVKKTTGGIVALVDPTFIPVDVNISGTFGRRFRFMVGNSIFNGASARFSNPSLGLKIPNTPFSVQIKTGYGSFKILESIFRAAKSLDEKNNPYSLYLYNPAIGNNYLVAPVNLTKQMNLEKNMIWSYNLSLRAIAPIANLQEKTNRLEDVLAIGTINKGIDIAVNNLKRELVNAI